MSLADEIKARSSTRIAEGYLIAEAAEAVGLPPGVLNVVTADRPSGG
jgi:acyl-CoA reductase-like NAD-dependent aldehyde dehydrogenase